MTDSDPSDMVDSLQATYPEYCAIMVKETAVKEYQRGRTERIARYEDHIDSQSVLIGKLTAACETLRAEVKELKKDWIVVKDSPVFDDTLPKDFWKDAFQDMEESS